MSFLCSEIYVLVFQTGNLNILATLNAGMYICCGEL